MDGLKYVKLRNKLKNLKKKNYKTIIFKEVFITSNSSYGIRIKVKEHLSNNASFHEVSFAFYLFYHYYYLYDLFIIIILNFIYLFIDFLFYILIKILHSIIFYISNRLYLSPF